MNPTLLTRDEFRAATFERDGHRCVICGAEAKDAHHILERRLWHDGGYYLENGASLCEDHHILAEQTVLSCDDVRQAAHLAAVVLPPHLYEDQQYDKWGNALLPNGRRVKGELFHDASVQKSLRAGGVLDCFTPYVKHPRTHHLPWSESVGDDDRLLADLGGFEGEEVVATVKMDGEQTTMYRDHIHARSIDSGAHPSRTWVKNLHAQIAHEIPEGWRVCGENLYAVHSIHYHHLPTYFLVHSVWNDQNVCLSWDETIEWGALFGLDHVPVLYRGPWDEARVRLLYQPHHAGDECEGYVVRVARPFHYGEYRRVVGKHVRAGHLHTHGHWMRAQLTRNGLHA